MKNYLFGLLLAMFLTVGFQVDSTAHTEEVTASEVTQSRNEIASSLAMTANHEIASSYLLAMTSPGVKVAVYSVPLPAENKIVLVRDPKGFVLTAIRHSMEFIAIKPMDKGEFWEIVPVFYTESSVSFKPDTVEKASDEVMELLRVVAVKDFLRYN